AAPTAQRLREQLLVVAPAVHVGRIDEVDAEVERTVDQRDGLDVLAGAVGAREGHASEAEGRDRQRAFSKRPKLHGASSPGGAGFYYTARAGRLSSGAWHVRVADGAAEPAPTAPPHRRQNEPARGGPAPPSLLSRPRSPKRLRPSSNTSQSFRSRNPSAPSPRAFPRRSPSARGPSADA